MSQISTQELERSKSRSGYAYATAAYVFWGVAPVYFVLVSYAAPLEVLAHRVVWSVPLLALLITISRQWTVLQTIRMGQWLTLALCAGLLSVNWLTFVYAVQAEKISETALGYYIIPLLSVVLGWALLGEKMRPGQWFCVVVAAVGVFTELWGVGTLPWLALVLALTFGFYGLLRKQLGMSSAVGLGVETTMVLPLAFAYLVWMSVGDAPSRSMSELLWLGLGGVVTVTPLLWFASAAVRVPLTTLSFFQYLAPSISLLIAVFAYDESVSVSRWICFGCIWFSLTVFTIENTIHRRKIG